MDLFQDENDFFDAIEEENEYVDDDSDTDSDDENALPQYLPVSVNPEAVDVHQVEMSNKAASRLRAGKGSLLCPPVGAGKTRIAIRTVALAHARPLVLVTMPVAIMGQWKDEINLLLGTGVEMVMYHGSKGRRLAELARIEKSKASARFVLTTVETIRNDVATLLEVSWTTLVIDEIHRVKNVETKANMALRRFPQAKIGITATPCAGGRAEQELASLIEIVHPGSTVYAAGVLAMAEEYVITKTREQMGIRNVPHKNMDFYCTFYEFELKHYIQVMEEVGEAHDVFQRHMERAARDPGYRFSQAFRNARKVYIMALQELRVASVYSPLHDVMADLHRVKEEFAPRLQAARSCAVHYAHTLEDREAAFDEVYRLAPRTCKIDAVLKKAEELNATGPVVIFSDFKVPLHIIVQHTTIPCSILNGSMSPRRRQEVLDEWKSGKTRILLASKRACGVGLNLPEASRAIFLDRDWNPQAEDQAKGRLDRRTQTAAELRFCHFVVPGTFDVVRFGVHESKREQMDLALGKRVDEDNFIAPIYEAISHFSEVYTKWCQITAGDGADTASSSQQAMWNAEMNAYELQHFGGEQGQAKATRKMAMLKLLQAEARRAEELGISVEELRIRRRHEENRVREEVRAKELARDEADAAKLNMGVRELKRKRKAALSERAKSKGITVYELIREEKRARMAAKPAASARVPLQPLVQPLPQAQ